LYVFEKKDRTVAKYDKTQFSFHLKADESRLFSFYPYAYPLYIISPDSLQAHFSKQQRWAVAGFMPVISREGMPITKRYSQLK
jgi:hypothetical protein